MKPETKKIILISELASVNGNEKHRYVEIVDAEVVLLSKKAAKINNEWLPKYYLKTDGERIFCPDWMHGEKY